MSVHTGRNCPVIKLCVSTFKNAGRNRTHQRAREAHWSGTGKAGHSITVQLCLNLCVVSSFQTQDAIARIKERERRIGQAQAKQDTASLRSFEYVEMQQRVQVCHKSYKGRGKGMKL